MTGDIIMGDGSTGNDIRNVKSITFSNVTDNIDFNNKQLKNISAPTDARDAITKISMEYTLLDYLKKYGWKVTHEIDVANCDIEYWAGNPTLVRNIKDRKTVAVGVTPDEAHSMSVDNKGTPTYLRCRRSSNDTAIRIPCDYIDKYDYTILIVARRDTRWTNNDNRRDLLFSNSDGNWDMSCSLGTGSSQDRIYITGGLPPGEVHTNIPDATKLDNVFCLSMHCNIGHGRSFLYFNGSKLGFTWTKDYRRSGVAYLSVGSHPNVSTSNYTPDMSIFLVRIIKREMSGQDITSMHTDLMTRFNIT